MNSLAVDETTERSDEMLRLLCRWWQTPPVSALVRVAILVVALVGVGTLVFVAGAVGAVPDGRAYELVSPVEKNGVAPYAAVPSSNGEAVDFQARGAFAGATSGSLNLYQASRTAGGWRTTPLTPTPTTPLSSLEEQVPVWFSSDLSSTIFTTPESYAAGDEDRGALDLYSRAADGGLIWISQGPQGGGEPKQDTFDGTTPDGRHVFFSTGATLLPAAKGLNSETLPEPEFLYEHETFGGQTRLVNLDGAGHPAGYVATTLSEPYTQDGTGNVKVASLEGLVTGQLITVGTGAATQTARIEKVVLENGEAFLRVEDPELSGSFPVGTPLVHPSEGAILGDGGHLTSGLSPASEYLPSNAGSGSTTNAVSSDGAKVFFESPNPAAGVPVGLYMRDHNTATVKIAGATQYGTTLSGITTGESGVFGSARYQGAAADGSLVFFSSEEGIAGATIGQEVYEFNTTEHEIGGVAPLSARPVSAGLGGDKAPVTTLTAPAEAEATIQVASTSGFHVGEKIAFAPFEGNAGRHDSTEIETIASIDSATQLTLVTSLQSGAVRPAGLEVHGVHPAYVTGIANDGSHVYFISNGELATNANAQGATAVPAEPNLYVFDTSTAGTTFIGTLAGSDVGSDASPSGLAGEPDISRPVVPTPDGSVLVFASAANLTGQNPWQEYTEIYRYSIAGNTLTCLSCTAPGVRPTGNATFGETAGGTYDPPGLSSPMSEDGSRVFFDSPDSLVPEDVNGGAPLSPEFGTPTSTDTYEWSAGKVSLISSGSASTPSVLMGTTPSGDDVLFSSTSQLVPSESDGGYENIFDARVGGGFSPTAAPSCVGSSCEAAFGLAPVSAVPAGEPPRAAAGRVASARARVVKRMVARCRKGLVRKRVKGRAVCVRRARKARGGAHRTS